MSSTTEILNGVKIERYFTKDGQHPYDAIEWSKFDVIIKHEETGEVKFEQREVEFPTSYSQTAINIITSKYFKGRLGTEDRTWEHVPVLMFEPSPNREWSYKQLIDRVIWKNVQWGIEQGYFSATEDIEIYSEELTHIILHQMFYFNSPVWFNMGFPNRPQTASACFINEVHDSMESILEFNMKEGLIFKAGSGSGVNVSSLRSKYEGISTGGSSSGALSFMRVSDANAGAIKSGGTCLAPYQLVYTQDGPKTVKELAESEKDFITLSYDPPASRFKAKKARAWKSGNKEVIRIVTDKGSFDLSYDHPVNLSDNKVLKVKDLKIGMSLLSCTIDDRCGYLRVGLRDGKKGKRKLHQLIVNDVMGIDSKGLSIHHIDENKYNNDPINLSVVSQNTHARYHNMKLISKNKHVFQVNKFSHPGNSNGMHNSSLFWNNAEKVNKYKEKQKNILLGSNRSHDMQKKATYQRMLNSAYELINNGYEIDTFEQYVEARTKHFGRIDSLKRLKKSIEKNFGSYYHFVESLCVNNHRILEFINLGNMDVYDVEVDCPTADDKTENSGHNFVIWPYSDFTGSGIVVQNTRRAAKMVIMNVDHPEIIDFITCKVKEEEKAYALIREGYESSYNGEAYSTVAFQNANHSVRVSDEFMNMVETDEDFWTKSVTTGKKLKKTSAKMILKAISEATWKCGDPGLQFDDTINSWNTVSNTDRLKASNPCITGDSLISTNEGLKKIKDLVGTNPTIVNENGTFSRATKVFETGYKPIYLLKTKSGYSIKATSEHLIRTFDGDKKVIQLKTGDKLKIGKVKFGYKALETDDAFAIGLLLGDGCLSTSLQLTMDHNKETKIVSKFVNCINRIKNSTENRSRQSITAGDCNEYNTATSVKTSTSETSVIEFFKKYILMEEGCENKRLNDICFSLNKDTIRNILRGLFTADGTVECNKQKNNHIALDSTSISLLSQVKLLLLGFGIKSKLYDNRRGGKTSAMLPDGHGGNKEYFVKPMYSLRITRSSRTIFETEIGFDNDSEKSTRLKDMNTNIETYKDHLDYDEFVSREFVGYETVYDLTEPETHHFVANGLIIHNCSEYLHVNDTSCNLGSINIMKFYDTETGIFDVEGFVRVCQLSMTAMDIWIDKADYPVESIAQGTKLHRTIGLGYANLGSLIMALGFPYDSKEGTTIAAAITSLMTAAAYEISAINCEHLPPFPKWEANKEPMADVLKRHYSEHKKISKFEWVKEILKKANDLWDSAIKTGAKLGFRNAYVSNLAPTGTIGLSMDCDTLGCEPELALIKYKKLAGSDVVIQMVNGTVKMALKRLGYSPDDIKKIEEYIKSHSTMEGCELVNEEHLPIFDTSFTVEGFQRHIHHMGHVRMLAAIQPFLSGGISKTINMPEKSTVEEIMDAYIQSWKLGLKCVAIYRDNSKGSQPLSTIKNKRTRATRVKLPDDTDGKRHKFSINGYDVYIHTGTYEDGSLGEVFMKMGKMGSTLQGLVDAIAKDWSLLLQYGIPAFKIVEKHLHSKFEPSGFTGNKEIPMASSICDYAARYIALNYLNEDEKKQLGIAGTTERKQELDEQEKKPVEDKGQVAVKKRIKGKKGASDTVCSDCGSLMSSNGSCLHCENCGKTSSCS